MLDIACNNNSIDRKPMLNSIQHETEQQNHHTKEINQISYAIISFNVIKN